MDREQRQLTHDQIGAVQTLKPSTSAEIKLEADSEVLCIHRGRNLTQGGLLVRAESYPRRIVVDEERQPNVEYVGDYVDMWDSKHYVIAPGYFYCKLGAAKHFKDRAVVPGSRNPEERSQASFIAIIGVVSATARGFDVLKAVDDDEEWAPFSDEEVAQYSIEIEAIDRGAMVDPIDEKVAPLALSGGHRQAGTSRVKSGGGTRKQTTRIEGGKGGAAALKKGETDSGRLGEIASPERSAAINSGQVSLED